MTLLLLISLKNNFNIYNVICTDFDNRNYGNNFKTISEKNWVKTEKLFIDSADQLSVYLGQFQKKLHLGRTAIIFFE